MRLGKYFRAVLIILTQLPESLKHFSDNFHLIQLQNINKPSYSKQFNN